MRRTPLKFAGILCLYCVGGMAAHAFDLADEAKSLQLVCGNKCHNLQVVTDTPRSIDDWRDTMQKMVDRGARGTDDQYDDILDFLHRTMSTIDVNSADSDELAVVLGLPDAKIKLITARRALKKFTDLKDLESILGIDAAALDAKARLLFFQ
jgi:competence protein ComEA